MITDETYGRRRNKMLYE